MNIVIASREIGSVKHLCFDGDSWEWSEDFDPLSVFWGFENSRDIRESLCSLGIEIESLSQTKFGKAIIPLLQNSEDIPWRYCIPRESYVEYIKYLVDQLWCVINDEANSYYITTFLRNRGILQGLSTPIVDNDVIKNIVATVNQPAHQTLGTLKRFKADKNGKCEKTIYSLSSSKTGRMTVKSGPNILTLRKDFRKIFQSSYDDGMILEVDVSSIEPRVALSLTGKTYTDDVYDTIISDLAGVKIDRQTAKIATLSSIYGASHHSLSSYVPATVNSKALIDKIRKYFMVDEIEKILNDQVAERGYMSNTHGRKIFTTTPSMNYLIQSSAVDVAFDIFEKIIEKSQSMKIRFKTLYLIHDAIIIDIHKDDFNIFKSICKDGFESEKVHATFPVKLKEIS